jgi:prevent-host-death family protein
MAQKTVTSTEFQTRAGAYIEQSAKQPVIITKYHRPVRVLMDIEEYERLKRYDTRQAVYPHELNDELKAELDKGYQGKATPKLDHLLD